MGNTSGILNAGILVIVGQRPNILLPEEIPSDAGYAVAGTRTERAVASKLSGCLLSTMSPSQTTPARSPSA